MAKTIAKAIGEDSTGRVKEASRRRAGWFPMNRCIDCGKKFRDDGGGDAVCPRCAAKYGDDMGGPLEVELSPEQKSWALDLLHNVPLGTHFRRLSGAPNYCRANPPSRSRSLPSSIRSTQ